MDSLGAGEGGHFGEFMVGGGEGGLQAVDFTNPAVVACFVDAFEEVGADVEESLALCGVGAQQGAADAPLTELLRGSLVGGLD